MHFRHPLLLILATAVFSVSPITAGESRLKIQVTPRVSTAPAMVRVRAIVLPDENNRALQIAADSGDFYRSSYVFLNGADAAAVTETTFKNLPGGRYEVSVALVSTQGRQIVERMSIMVTSGAGER